MVNRASFLFVAFWMCSVNLSAQQNEMISKHYLMSDGLPEEGINAIMQDSRGFIWLATYSGLCKFDGYRFTTYKNNPASSNTLKNNRVNSVLEDEKGRLWVGHAQGVDVFDPRTEVFYLHWPESYSLIHSTTRLRKKKDGKIWICTSEGVYTADPETFKIERFSHFTTATMDVAETRDGSVVFASNGAGIYYVDAKSRDTLQFNHDPGSVNSVASDYFGWSVHVDDQDRIWVGTNASIELFNPNEKSFTSHATNTQVLDIQENPDGKLWLGCGDGLYTFDPESENIDKLTNDDWVFNVMRDRQGVTWISSLEGFRQLYSKSKPFNIYTQFPSIGSIVEDVNHDIWILSSPKRSLTPALYKFNPSLGTSKAYGRRSPSDSKGYPIDTLRYLFRTLFRDKNGHVWMASPRLLEKYNAKDHVFFIHSTLDVTLLPIASFIDSRGTVWLANWDHVYKVSSDTSRGEFLHYSASTVYSFFEDANQNLWLGTMGGLIRYNLLTGKLDTFKNKPDDSQSLSNNTVYHIIADRTGSIWIGTAGGLNRIIKGTENEVPRFENWRTQQSELPNDDVYCIVDGGDGTFWMTCGNVISHFFPSQKMFRNYDSRDGLPGRNFRGDKYLNGKGLRSHNGTIFFGGTDGLVVFHPDSLKDNEFVPPIALSGFSIHNKPVPVPTSNADSLTWKTPLTQSISYTREVRLSHDQNDFRLEFSALNFINPEHNLYKYKLEPYESDWIEADASSRSAHYTNIDPGKYTFRVIGSNNDGVWNEEGASLLIIIAPPWWRTWWAYTLYGIAFVSLLVAGRKSIIHRERLTAKLKLEHLELEKVQEIDKVKTNFFANISHEFRTPITLIHGPLKEMYSKASDEEERSVIGVMLRNAKRLSRLINQLLDLSKLEAGKMNLHAHQVELVQFLREIASSYESIAENKKIKYFFYPEVTELSAYIDAEKLEKVVHNLLSNAFKFTNERGEIILYLKQDGKQCNIMVKDTGIGIPADQLNKIFDRFYQVDSSQTRVHEGSGLGMALAKELVELHHGTIAVESLEGKGATFTVRLPLGKDHLHKDEIIDPVDFMKSEIVYEDLVGESRGEIENEKSTVPADNHVPILLIVEDNADMRHYIRKTFSNYYMIIEAANGKEGIAKAEEIIPDLIISDIMMPEMDGYRFCERIKTKELTSHIPVILLTAKADRESKLTGLETGADDYLSKPFDADELKLIVRNRIEQRKKIRERFSRGITLEPKQIAITSFDEKFLNKVMTIIEDHIGDENFSIEELSREVGYSNMHFYRKLKALAGETPSQFLRTIRLKRAAELLRKKSDNVTQIAYSVGFNSLSYFNKCFKEQFGVTPGQFSDESLKSHV